jgi:hypothetical protein
MHAIMLMIGAFAAGGIVTRHVSKTALENHVKAIETALEGDVMSIKARVVAALAKIKEEL